MMKSLLLNLDLRGTVVASPIRAFQQQDFRPKSIYRERLLDGWCTHDGGLP